DRGVHPRPRSLVARNAGLTLQRAAVPDRDTGRGGITPTVPDSRATGFPRLKVRSGASIVRPKEGHHDQENTLRASPALRADALDGRERDRPDASHARGAFGHRA